MSFKPEKIAVPPDRWQSPKKSIKKKRKLTGSPNSSFESENRFNALNPEIMDIVLENRNTEDEKDLEEQEAEESKVKIPPIVVHSYVNNHMETLNKIKEEMKEDFVISAKNNRLIIKTKNIDDYNLMLKKVSDSKVEYHTYTIESEKILKLVLKGLAPNIQTDVIKENLISNGLKVNVVKQFQKNVLVNGQKTVMNLPIYIIEFASGTKPKDVYKINRVCYCVVRWEKFQNGDKIVQCYNCQCFGHVSTNCHKKVKCVLCADEHSLKDCPFKEQENQLLKCANCGEKHSAGSRECKIYKKMLENRNNRGSTLNNHERAGKKTLYDTHSQNSSNNNGNAHNERLYSHVTTGHRQERTQIDEQNTEHSSVAGVLADLWDFAKHFNFVNIIDILKKMLLKIRRANDGFGKIMCVIEALTEFF